MTRDAAKAMHDNTRDCTMEDDMRKKGLKIMGWMLVFGALLLAAPASAKAQSADASDQKAFRAVFDASYYYNANPDVAAACGKSDAALFKHFTTFGIYEGRSGNREFNALAYKERNPDLQQAFGSDLAEYCRHYISFGKSEGRNAKVDGQDSVVIATIVPNGAPKVASAKPEGEPADEAVAEAADQSANGESGAAAGGVIGTCTTKFDESESRASNVHLAAQRINGVTLQPGQAFSFSSTVKERTRANGYVEGTVFVNGKESTGIGGGICQVSSTLYAAMVYANLPATERHAHSRQVDYLPAGLDATIAGDYYDLKFTNIYDRPLQIQASAQNGSLTVSLVLQ